MKKIWTIGMMLLLMSSCVKHADIYLKLSEEDAAAIPYREGQAVKFLNQDGDTVTYEVTRDEIYPYNGEQYINAIHGGDVMHPAPHSTECYARTVILYEQLMNYSIDTLKQMIIDDDPFIEFFSATDNYNLYDWYYNEEFGLLYFEKGDFSLTRIP